MYWISYVYIGFGDSHACYVLHLEQKESEAQVGAGIYLHIVVF
jgi:hypothetical protein